MSLNKVDIKVNWMSPVRFPGSDVSKGPNLKAIDAALEAIDDSPENWDQSDWATREYSMEDKNNLPGIVVEPAPHCGTAMCLAGHVVTQAGYYLLFEDGFETTATAVDSNGQRYFIDHLAQSLLSLTRHQAEALFEYTNTREGLQWVRDQIAQTALNASYPEV